MSLFDTSAGTNATATDADFSVDGIFNGLMTVLGFCRQIIDFLKSIFTPIFESLFDSASGKIDEMIGE